MDLAISEYIINKCQLSQCNYINNHSRVYETDDDWHENDKNNIENLKYYDLYKDTKNTLHFYVLHLFQKGLRYHDVDKKEEDKTDDLNKSEHFDPLSHKMSRSSKNQINQPKHSED